MMSLLIQNYKAQIWRLIKVSTYIRVLHETINKIYEWQRRLHEELSMRPMKNTYEAYEKNIALEKKF